MPSASATAADAPVDWVEYDRETARRGFAPFVRRVGWDRVEPATLSWATYLDELCDGYTRLARFEIPGLVANVPPATGKSTLVQVLWPAWVWTWAPDRRFTFSSYAMGVLHRYGGKFLRLMSSDWWRRRWPESYVDPNARVLDLENASGGTRFAATVGGSNIGRHGHHWAGDDLLNPFDVMGNRGVDPYAIEVCTDWLLNVMPRSILPGGNASLVMQRLHEQDPTPVLIAARKCVHIRRPMEADGAPCPVTAPHTDVEDKRAVGELLTPEYVTREMFDALRPPATSPAAFAAQYQQRPSPIGGSLFQREWFGSRYKELPAVSRGVGRWVQFWDTAFRDGADNSRVAGCLLHAVDADVYVVDVRVGHMSYVETKQTVLDFTAGHDALVRSRVFGAYHVLIEGKANGDAIISDLKGEIPGLQTWPPKGMRFPSKGERWTAATPALSAGNVHFPEGAPWVSELVEEHMGCRADGTTSAAYDDLPDMLSGALIHLRANSQAVAVDEWVSKGMRSMMSRHTAMRRR